MRNSLRHASQCVEAVKTATADDQDAGSPRRVNERLDGPRIGERHAGHPAYSRDVNLLPLEAATMRNRTRKRSAIARAVATASSDSAEPSKPTTTERGNAPGRGCSRARKTE